MLNNVWGIPLFNEPRVTANTIYLYQLLHGQNAAQEIENLNFYSNLTTALKIVHIVSIAIGYLSYYSLIVGIGRLTIGLGLLANSIYNSLTTLENQTDEREKFSKIEKYLPLELGLIARGALEIIPFGKLLNLGLDITTTLFKYYLLKNPAPLQLAASDVQPAAQNS
jgi:hypothetical protein